MFPVTLIILGLWLATLALFKDGVPRTMSPEFLYPPTNTLYYNYESTASDVAAG